MIERIQNKHPEINEGEIFIGNMTAKQFDEVGWKTKRLGFVAFDAFDKTINNDKNNRWLNMYPVFIEKAEVEKKIQELKGKGQNSDLEKLSSKALEKLLERVG